MTDFGVRLRRATAAALGLLAFPAVAVPPPVEVVPLVASAEPQSELAGAVRALIADAGREGHYAVAAVERGPVEIDCALDGAQRDRCFADAARAAAVANLVFVIAAPASDTVRLTCVSADSARAQQAEISLAVATGDDAAARLRERSALARCLIGALHAPPRG